MARKRLFEGFARGAGEVVRNFFARSNEQDVADIRQGGIPSVERAGMPYTLASHYGYDSLAEHLRIDQDLQSKYTDVENMDEYPELICALDIYADDSCTPNLDRDESIWVTSKDDLIAKDLNDMLHKKVMVENDIWGNSRTVCKYGDSYGELLVNENGVIGINYLPSPTVRRVEDPRGNLLGFVQDVRGEFNITMEDFYALAQERGGGGSIATSVKRNRAPGELTVFEDWEIIHWRLRGKHLRSVYGETVLDAARWVWKRLSLLEDALLIYKLERAPSRYAFYIDVGQLDAERGLAHVNRVKNTFTRKKFINSQGKLDMRYNPLCLHGDTKVHLLTGESRTIEDMAHAFGRDEEQWVWTVDLDDESKLRPGRVVWAGKTRENAQLVQLTLDNGETVKVTPDHKMICRNGQKVEAQHLLRGDSLMPFRRRVSSKNKGDTLEGYELVYCPKARKSLYGHRVIANDLGLKESDQLVHHIDFDWLNNDPSNLKGITHEDHRNYHLSMGHSGKVNEIVSMVFDDRQHDGFDSFRSDAIGDNHKVVSIEWLEEPADTFTLTVEGTHTFALKAGIFVCNSMDEDFFIPVRDGKRTTEIDVIQGPDYTETDSLEYHRDKLVSATKIPKMYFGYGGEAVQGQLSTQDIRFARTIMRIQQTLRGGYRKGCRVHLIATNREPDKIDYQVQMTVPSAILELARVEVLNTTADLATRMGEIVSTKWILVHLFKFSEAEAVRVMEEKNQEIMSRGKVEADVQKMQMQSVGDESISGGSPSITETQRFDQRLSKLMNAVRRDDWRREFYGRNKESEKRAEHKLDQLLRNNAIVNKRVRELGGLLSDIRKSMRTDASW